MPSSVGDSQTGLQTKSRLPGPLPGNPEEGSLGLQLSWKPAGTNAAPLDGVALGERLKKLFPAGESGPLAVGLLGLLHEGPRRWLGVIEDCLLVPGGTLGTEGDDLRSQVLPREAQEAG